MDLQFSETLCLISFILSIPTAMCLHWDFLSFNFFIDPNLASCLSLIWPEWNLRCFHRYKNHQSRNILVSFLNKSHLLSLVFFWMMIPKLFFFYRRPPILSKNYFDVTHITDQLPVQQKHFGEKFLGNWKRSSRPVLCGAFWDPLCKCCRRTRLQVNFSQPIDEAKPKAKDILHPSFTDSSYVDP